MNIRFGFYPQGKTKAMTMSYDDGNVADRRLIEIFNKYGIKGTFHLNSGFFGRPDYVEENEIPELYKGHEISVHTLTHPALDEVPPEIISAEISEDRRNLEELSGYVVTGMSYPYGAYNNNVIKILATQHIEYSRTTQSHKSFRLPENFLTWHPTCHHNDEALKLGQKFIDLHKPKSLPLLYVWGHSYEFDRQNNWNYIEEFSELMANRNDIWYATNIEICRYIKALKSLQFSADMTIVYNPSAIAVWIGVNDQSFKVPGGATCKLK